MWDEESSEGFTKPLQICETNTHVDRGSISSFQRVATDANIMYTYDVTWKYSETAWASRWDVYLSEDPMVPAQVHWYSITNSILVVPTIVAPTLSSPTSTIVISCTRRRNDDGLHVEVGPLPVVVAKLIVGGFSLI